MARIITTSASWYTNVDYDHIHKLLFCRRRPHMWKALHSCLLFQEPLSIYLSMLDHRFCFHFLLLWSISHEMWNVNLCRMHTTSACRSSYPLPLLEHRQEPCALPSHARSVTSLASAKHPTPSPALPEKVATTLMALELRPLAEQRLSQMRVLRRTLTSRMTATMCMGARQRAITKSNGAHHRPPS